MEGNLSATTALMVAETFPQKISKLGEFSMHSAVSKKARSIAFDRDFAVLNFEKFILTLDKHTDAGMHCKLSSENPSFLKINNVIY